VCCMVKSQIIEIHICVRVREITISKTKTPHVESNIYWILSKEIEAHA
jgi:hypothetical protein